MAKPAEPRQTVPNLTAPNQSLKIEGPFVMRSERISLTEYFAAEGSRFSNADAKIIGPVLESLAAEGNELTARGIVDIAHSTNSPLHPYFEWDDASAADQFRLGQAQIMMRSIRVKTLDGETKPVSRAFRVAAPPEPPVPRENRSFKALHGESALAAQTMAAAHAEMQAFRSKYEPYRNIWGKFSEIFGPVLSQIAECEGELADADPPALADAALVRLKEMRDEIKAASSPWDIWVEQSTYLGDAIAEATEAFSKARVMRHADCLRCKKSYLAIDAGNRLCPSCSSRVAMAG
jgi:hypothetical protein